MASGALGGRAGALRVFDVVAGQGVSGEFHGENLWSKPQGHLTTRQSFFTIYTPMLEASGTRGAEDAGEPVEKKASSRSYGR
jgi:hypothetical protein